MKNLFIRCSEETYHLAHEIAKKESRSLNKQIIHMIHNEADRLGVDIPSEPEWVKKVLAHEDVPTTAELSTDIKVGLQGLVGTSRQGFHQD
jgi:hypothetical protein